MINFPHNHLPFLTNSATFLQNTISVALTSQQKRIAILAVFIFGCLVATYYAIRSYFNEKKIDTKDIEDSVKPAESLNKKEKQSIQNEGSSIETNISKKSAEILNLDSFKKSDPIPKEKALEAQHQSELEKQQIEEEHQLKILKNDNRLIQLGGYDRIASFTKFLLDVKNNSNLLNARIIKVLEIMINDPSHISSLIPKLNDPIVNNAIYNQLKTPSFQFLLPKVLAEYVMHGTYVNNQNSDLLDLSCYSIGTSNLFDAMLDEVIERLNLEVSTSTSSIKQVFLAIKLKNLFILHWDLHYNNHLTDPDKTKQINKLQSILLQFITCMMNQLPPKEFANIYFQSLAQCSKARVDVKGTLSGNAIKDLGHYERAYCQYRQFRDLMETDIPKAKEKEILDAMAIEALYPDNHPPLFISLYIFDKKLWKNNIHIDTGLFTFEEAIRLYTDFDGCMPAFFLRYHVEDENLVAKALDLKGRQELFKPKIEYDDAKVKDKAWRDAFRKQDEAISNKWLIGSFEGFDDDWKLKFFPGCSITSDGNSKYFDI